MKTLAISLSALLMITLANASHAQAQSGNEGPRVRIDVGASTGKRGDDTYTEGNVGINLSLAKGLVWRNAIFGRFQTDTKDVYGLDSSIRGVLDFGDSRAGASLFVAPGYRFTSDGVTDPAPLGEAGLTLRLGGVSVGGGIKTIFNELVHNGVENETQYFVTVGGVLNL